jgi:hypothetical protein
MHWDNLDETTAAIVDMGLNIMVYKGYTWSRVWQFLIHQTECKNLVLAKDSIYSEYISRGGKEYSDDEEYDSE